MTTLAAPAKLTRTLRVTGVRDDGYHLIDAEMVSLDLADELTFADGDRLTLDGPEACLLYTSPSPRDLSTSRMPSSA